MNPDYLSRMEREMKLRNFSKKTIKSYLYQARRFLVFIQKPPESVTENDVRKYIHYSFRDDGSNFSAVRQSLSALKFLFSSTLHKNLLLNIPYPKKEHRLPAVLTRDEVCNIFSLTDNPKHRLLLKMIYSCGLRVSEAANIKVTDMDLSNRTLHIRCSKGKRDRMVPIPESLCHEIRDFLEPEHHNPYLFRSGPGRKGHITISAVQRIVKNISRKAGIKKPVHPHTLRHSFATHLLDQGTDIRFIQAFLGHKRITTTELYTQVSTVSLKGITNPLDQLPNTKPKPRTN